MSKERDVNLPASVLQERYLALLEAFDGFIYICSADFQIEYMNASFIERCGADGQGQRCHQVLHHLDQRCPWCQHERVQAGETLRWEIQSPLDHRWYDITNVPIAHPNGSVSKLAMIRDITDRKEMDSRLRQSEAKLRMVIDLAVDALLMWDDRGVITDVNRCAVELSGYTRQELIGQPIQNIFSAEELVRMPLRFDLLHQGLTVRKERFLTTKAGQTIPVEMRTKQMPDGSFQSFLRDVRESWRAQESLRESERRYLEMANALPIGIFEADLTGVLKFVNSTTMGWFGYSEGDLARGINLLDTLDPADRPRVVERMKQLLSDQETLPYEYSVVRKDGSPFSVIIMSTKMVNPAGQPVGYRGIILDVTEQRRLEGALKTAQKHEALGLLAGGIAHDFGNLLTGIFGYLEIIRAKLPADSLVQPDVEKAFAAFGRARALTQQLLTFAKSGTVVRQVVSIETLLRETVEFALIGSGVKAVFLFPDNLWNGSADPFQLSQVVENLVINARQAMPDGGLLTVDACNLAESQALPPSLPAGRYLRLQISDTGSGIPHENLSRIFDPFFTTKAQGTGLGLATSNSIIVKHGGLIEVESELGRGTTFSIYLPALA